MFSNEQFGSVRTVMVNGEVMFIGEDVVRCLGYDLDGGISYSKYLKRHCDEDDYILYDKTQTQIGLEFNYKELGQRGGYLINESGLYALILGSQLESAKQFKHWVTKEVLPSIRKHGAYATDVTIEKICNDPDFGIQLLTKLKEEKKARVS